MALGLTPSEHLRPADDGIGLRNWTDIGGVQKKIEECSASSARLWPL
ncbi:hypothetical protein Q3C01_17830 [Bradyrhizobium sp. UFLA05-109]